MSGRLIIAIVTTLIYEAALAAFVLWGLPGLGLDVFIPVLIILMLALGAAAVYTYLKGSKALRNKAMIGLPGMVGSKARAVSSLNPSGMVKIKGELWEAVSSGDKIEAGEEVVVVGQKRLKLIVSKTGVKK